MDLWESKESLVLLAREEKEANKVSPEVQDLRERSVSQDPQDSLVNKVSKDPQDPQDLWDHKDPTVSQDKMDKLDLLVTVVSLVFPEALAFLELWE